MAMRDSQSSYQPQPTSPIPPPVARSPRAREMSEYEDLPFQYSTTGPPTVYSQLETSWSQPSQYPTQTPGAHGVPPLPGNRQSVTENPFAGIEEEGDWEEEEENLYYRSDWEVEPKTRDTGWSRSSWAGPRTGASSRLGAMKEDEEWIPPVPTRTRVSAPADSVAYAAVEYAYDQGAVMDSPGEMSVGFGGEMTEGAGHAGVEVEVEAKQMVQRQSTFPSILELGHLTEPGAIRQHANNLHVDPFADQPNVYQGHVQPRIATTSNPASPYLGVQQRKAYKAQPTPDQDQSQNQTWRTAGSISPFLISPEAQQRLGRMSMATARYTLPPQRNRNVGENTRPADPKPPFLARSAIGRLYLTYRPFILPTLTLSCALLLTVINSSTPPSVGVFVKIGDGVFTGAQAGGDDGSSGVGLGAWGWCQLGLSDPTCDAYNDGDFENASDNFELPGSSSLSNLSSLLTALTATTWLLASFQTITAFLHFYLFFALSIPLNYLISTPIGEVRVQKEVDLRTRAEWGARGGQGGEYGAIWWSWWGHQRSPLGWVFGLVVGGLSLGTVGTTVLFKKAIEDGTGSSDVRFGTGILVPLITFILTLDSFISSVLYFFKAKTNINTFLNPPEPSAMGLLLPSSSQKMQHIRQTQGSFFAPRQSTLPPNTSLPLNSGYADEKGVWNDAHAPGLPNTAVELDPETVRWLGAYPADEELVSLIADLRMGKTNDDFLLSDVGLLYLHPISDDEPALLVPPNGTIRHELIEDAHLDVSPYGDHDPGPGQVAHNEIEVMVAQLGDTFWWNGLARDCAAYVEGCKVCKERKRVERIEERAGMTAIPWTGVTGWTQETGGVGESEMAAEMAFAMRKAQEEADKTRL